MGEGRDVLLVAGLVAAVAIVVGVTIWVGGSDDDDGGDRGAVEAGADTTEVDEAVDPDTTTTAPAAPAATPETTAVALHELADDAVVGGNAWLPSGGWFDLDDGAQNSTSRPATTDLYVESGALVAGQDTFVTSTDTPPTGPAGCDLTGLTPSVPLAQLQVGAAFCVQTNGGRTAAIEILVVEADQVRFSYDVWEL